MRQLKISKQITGRDSFSIEKYLQEIGKIDVLTPDEEVALAKKIRSGDRAARELLVKSNLRFVVSVAKQYQNNGLSLGDLINEGKLPNALTKRKDSSLFLMPCGGSGNRFYRQSPRTRG